ncbi:pyrroloquinoline quinone-dependent dehydrogenase [Alicyclobacillus tolerans]|uniref:Glucose dehydrogenase n=1 Tax=Alicyclobacillus tolerans TaxID=90970 RepID=A0A1M6U266_9BACL|nr:PQQ-binding-like beta-propeller repeat protein [Alicyclobacillus montanus]SHK63355.1 Glucose dehydrogenase [Alicyclobacillus montanus]
MNIKSRYSIWAAGLSLTITAVVGCSSAVSSSGMHPQHAHQGLSKNTPQTHKANVLQISTDWPNFGNNLWQNHLSPLRISQSFNMQLLYSQNLGNGGENESFPIEVGGVLYVTTMRDRVLALDASTGNVMWEFSPQLHLLQGIPTINRGVAVGQGKVFLLTADDRLVALSQQTGQLLYQVSVANESKGYFESMSPLYVDGKVFVGSAGGDEGVRGFEACYLASNGQLLWRRYTVPKRGEGWLPASGQHGGGAVWNIPAYNPQGGQLFFGTGNPSPDFYGVSRLGPDPMTDAVVSVNATTGKVNWYRQEVKHDLWDYDVASPPMLFPVQGKLAVGEAGKDGQWYEWYAANGQPVFSPVAFVKEQHRPPGAQPTLEWPGSDGGANYGPSAYDPIQQTVLISGINGPEYVKAGPTHHTSYRVDDGTSASPAPAGDWTGTLTSIRVNDGRIEWQRKLSTPAIGGVTTTMGGVAFFGEANGMLYAVNMKNGQTLWQYDAHIPVASAPIVYKLDGQIRVTYVLGQSASLQGLFPYLGKTKVLTFQIKARHATGAT